MFNPRQYGAATNSFIAKSIHQEDLQCNETINDRRQSLPPRIASTAPAPIRRGVGRGRGLSRGMPPRQRGSPAHFGMFRDVFV